MTFDALLIALGMLGIVVFITIFVELAEAIVRKGDCNGQV